MRVAVARAVHLDRLGTLLSVVGVAALWLLPFVVFKINRIVSGHPRALMDVLPTWSTLTFYLTLALVAVIAVAVGNARIRLLAALLGIIAVALVIGGAADALTPPGNRWVRISPGAGFWVLLIALGLIATDAIARLKPRPGIRVLALLVTAAVVAGALASGYFDHLSIMREYAVNASRFAREARQHVLLAVGSLVAAVLIGLPLGVICHRLPRVRAAILEVLSLIQTIPSIALFGILMVPLGALAAREPWAGQIGISGIGAAPAVIALFLYSLLPVVANTAAGLARVSPATVEAARGMGLTNWQVLVDIEFILALPVILTGIRIVLVQNIGLVTIAALIGGGGFGTFVFQGLGQTAIDLVLLGAIPTVALAFSSAVLLDAVVDVMNKALR
jgi:osmoprotectant transport system permease protein